MSADNKNRDWRIFELLYFRLLKHYELMLKKQHLARMIYEIKDQTIKLIDSTIINLCLSKHLNVGLTSKNFGLFVIYKEDENKVIEIITNQLD
jgi:hypothetical protein